MKFFSSWTWRNPQNPPPQKKKTHKKTTSQKSHSIIKFHCCNKLSIQRVLDNWNWLYITYSFWMFSLFNSMYFCLPYSARNWRWRWLCCQIEGTTMVSNRIWSCQIFRRYIDDDFSLFCKYIIFVMFAACYVTGNESRIYSLLWLLQKTYRL